VRGQVVARRVVVRGRVQGVFFRDSARRAARAAGVAGWVTNAEDGTLHAYLEGSPDAVEQVIGFLRVGPSAADVTDVEVADAEPQGASGFRVR
jgi:acylphosphatase